MKQLQEVKYEWLVSKGFTGQYQEMMYKYLVSLGYTGHYQEMLFNWYKAGGSIPPVPGYDPDAQALFNRFNIEPTEARKQLISDRFVAGKAKSFWAKLDALWVHAAHGPEAGRLNWLSTSYNCLPVNDPAFVIDRGYSGDGLMSYLDTQYNPATVVGGKFQRDSGSLGIRSNTNNAAAGSLAGFWDGTKGTTLNPRSAQNRMGVRINQASDVTGTNGSITSSIGMFVAVRDSASSVRGYREGTLVAASSGSNSTAPADGNLRLGAISAESLRACEFSMGFIGSGLTEQEVVDMYNWFEPYRIAVGVV